MLSLNLDRKEAYCICPESVINRKCWFIRAVLFKYLLKHNPEKKNSLEILYRAYGRQGWWHYNLCSRSCEVRIYVAFALWSLIFLAIPSVSYCTLMYTCDNVHVLVWQPEVCTYTVEYSWITVACTLNVYAWGHWVFPITCQSSTVHTQGKDELTVCK